MKQITQYKAKDGKIFDTETKCLEHENLIDQVDQIMNQLPNPVNHIKGSDFNNGGGYIQHKPEDFLKVKRELLELIKTKIDHHWIQQAIDALGTNEVHPSWVGRLLSDYNIEPFNNAWFRFSCTDYKYREWGQGYFALNPEKGKQVQLNLKEATNG